MLLIIIVRALNSLWNIIVYFCHFSTSFGAANFSAIEQRVLDEGKSSQCNLSNKLQREEQRRRRWWFNKNTIFFMQSLLHTRRNCIQPEFRFFVLDFQLFSSLFLFPTHFVHSSCHHQSATAASGWSRNQCRKKNIIYLMTSRLFRRHASADIEIFRCFMIFSFFFLFLHNIFFGFNMFSRRS